MKLADLKIDDDFKNLLPPLSKEEYTQLDRNISSKGFDEAYPIIIWNKTIIDGHNRYEICKFHGIEDVPVVEKHYSSKEDAIAAVYALQIGRRNLTPEQRKYCLGKQYEATKLAQGGDKKSKAQNELLATSRNTAERIAKEHSVGRETVKRAEKFAKGLDAADEVDPNIKKDVLTGKVKVTQKEITDIANADNVEKKKEMVQELRKPKNERKSRSVKRAERKIKNAFNGVSENAKNVFDEQFKSVFNGQTRICRCCGKELEIWKFSGKSKICKPCDAARVRRQSEEKNGLSVFAKETELLKDNNRDTSGTPENTYAEISALNSNWLSSYKRTISTSAYDKSTIASLIDEFISILKNEKEKL